MDNKGCFLFGHTTTPYEANARIKTAAKRGGLLKMWQKIFSMALAISVAALIYCASQDQKDCCVCGSFRYHAPGLIDLETGNMIELNLYSPHETKVAELADPQPEMSTFSFVNLGNVSGTKMTGNAIIEIVVPNADKTNNPVLCKDCLELLKGEYTGRYVLADLYDIEVKTLIPIAAGVEVVLRCYEITMSPNEAMDGIAVVVQGILE